MKKIGSLYSRTFSVSNLLLSKYEDGIIKSESWDISIELRCLDVLTLALVDVQGLSVENWLKSLFGQKLLAIEDADFLNHFQNTVFIAKFDESYIVSLIEMILKPNIPESIHIQSIELKISQYVD